MEWNKVHVSASQYRLPSGYYVKAATISDAQPLAKRKFVHLDNSNIFSSKVQFRHGNGATECINLKETLGGVAAPQLVGLG